MIVVLALPYAVAVLAELSLLVGTPNILILGPLVALLAAAAAPAHLIRLGGGPTEVSALAEGLERIQALTERLAGDDNEATAGQREIYRRLEQLGPFESPLATEYLALYRTTIRHFLGGGAMADRSEALRRMAELRELLNQELQARGIRRPFP